MSFAVVALQDSNWASSNVLVIFDSVDKILQVTIQMKVAEQYVSVVLYKFSNFNSVDENIKNNDPKNSSSEYLLPDNISYFVEFLLLPLWKAKRVKNSEMKLFCGLFKSTRLGGMRPLLPKTSEFSFVNNGK